MKKLLVVLMLFFTHVSADSWQCKNTFESQCSDGQCSVSQLGEFTPMSVYFDRLGYLSVCAYSGCWEGKGSVLNSHNYLIVSGQQIKLSTDSASQENIFISLDQNDNVALLKAGEFAHPLFCKQTTPQFFNYPSLVSDRQNHPIVFQGNVDAWMFRSRLREAHSGEANFAGHYIVTSWGCGASCLQAALIDTHTGEVYFPEELSGVGFLDTSSSDGELWNFNKDSHLFILHGLPANKPDMRIGTTYLIWEDNAFKEVSFTPHKQ